ncbi:MAG TPA: formate transporter FocA [Longilinea sp.]|nr:formate transporter FocA [Longilinea sp.]
MMSMNGEFSIDAILPPDMAQKAETIGVKKANMAAGRLFLLAILAGAFIALGAIFATTVSAGSITIKDALGQVSATSALPYGITRLVAGIAFSLGLILVIVGGAELFTGNNLIIMAFMSHKINLRQLLRNWAIVYAGNFIGSILTALIMVITNQYMQGNGAIGLNALNMANAKAGLSFIPALASGIMCNALVCLAVWLTYSARSTTDKILAIILPITAFVAAGFEHSVANMYFIPTGLFIKAWGNASFFQAIGKTAGDFANLTWGNFLGNLLPVTIGNIIGGAVMVGAVYWLVYLRKNQPRSILEPGKELS